MFLLLTADIAAAQSPPPSCARDDKACARKAIAAHPTRKSEFWRDAMRQPLEARIGPAPPELVEFLVLDVIANGYPNQPRAAARDAKLLADVRRALAEIPAEVRTKVAPKLAGIYLIEDIGGTGFTDSIRDASGRQVGGFIVLDPAVLETQTANRWATWKESTPFRPEAGYRLEARIEDAARDDRVRAIQYILLHELGHVLAIGAGIHPDWNVAPRDVREQPEYFARSWTIAGDRYESRQRASWPGTGKAVFYFGAQLGAREMAAVYAWLERTEFATLYASTHPADDFAEAFANYVHVVRMRRPFEIRITRDGRLEKSYRACWEQARCAWKRAWLERLLAP